MQIRVYIKNRILYFTLTDEIVEEENLNNTNIVDLYSFQFTKNYIHKHFNIVEAFLYLLLVKNKIKEVVIINHDIAVLACQLLKSFEITKIHFKEDKSLDYNIVRELLKIESLEEIDCYSMSAAMIQHFKKDVVKTRSEILFISNFMSNNHLDTYSKICNAEKIVLNCQVLSKEDFDDIKYFLDINHVLKVLYLENYQKKNFVTLINLLYNSGLEKLDLYIYASENSIKEISKDILELKDIDKKTNIHVKVKYGKEYKEKYKWAELNIKILRFILIFLVILSASIFGFSRYLNYKEKSIIDNNLESISEVVEKVVETEAEDNEDNVNTPVTNQENIPASIVGTTNVYDQKYTDAYKSLLNLNEDTIGWLKINNTKIDYPVVQTSDNKYYLDHAFDKTKNQSGWVFVDYRNNMDDLSQNTIIYAHNSAKKQIMFGSLKNVLNASWYNNSSNLDITFSIKGNKKVWRIFAIYTIDVTDDYLITDFKSRSSFFNYINDAKSKSIMPSSLQIKEDDKILTLSTCYLDSKHRLIVHAKLI